AFAPSATNQTTGLSDVPGDDSVVGSHADGFAPQSDTGDLAFDFGGDGPGGFVSAVYDGALGAEVTNSSAGGVTTITTDYWTLEINETTGAYTFTQTAAYPHAPGTATDQGSVAVTIEDSDGSTAVATITLNIGDDVPVATDDANGAAENGAAVLGNVLDNDDLGADHGTVGTDG
ncbi:hypothetical protein R2G56_21720, partial [Nitratireductor aquimarinus]